MAQYFLNVKRKELLTQNSSLVRISLVESEDLECEAPRKDNRNSKILLSGL